MHCEHIHTEDRDGFKIDFYACEEDTNPRGEFQLEDGSDDEELLAKIADGAYAWFVAEVTASKEGVVLGTEWLGGCCYESAQAFVAAGDYYEDMCIAAITTARATIAKLAA